jgi:hypothetical protein
MEAGDQTGRPAELPDGWQLATPERQGMDGALLDAIGPRLAGWPEGSAHGSSSRAMVGWSMSGTSPAKIGAGLRRWGPSPSVRMCGTTSAQSPRA